MTTVIEAEFEKARLKIWFQGMSTSRNIENVVMIRHAGNVMTIKTSEGKELFVNFDFEIVQRLLLQKTSHSGGTSTRKKCEQLGFDSYETIIIGESED
ncbi:hypothetical protein SAMN02745975_00548 [Geosporobacter subterraneus DSM 17957]|uniref:Uncharacterized protein n=1 Tax=Geosporobacter subterraneus DSM 17957 TaxID=1121919 RepID=A0A1M6DRJ3_9FIRM|nr:hypothetical protein [Geosporobacter subterraneus]SHI75815.1 hypothetical protein SAMN02745975_00548 [Geosporobacter subterraneus DSM 17957]